MFRFICNLIGYDHSDNVIYNPNPNDDINQTRELRTILGTLSESGIHDLLVKLHLDAATEFLKNPCVSEMYVKNIILLLKRASFYPKRSKVLRIETHDCGEDGITIKRTFELDVFFTRLLRYQLMKFYWQPGQFNTFRFDTEVVNGQRFRVIELYQDDSLDVLYGTTKVIDEAKEFTVEPKDYPKDYPTNHSKDLTEAVYAIDECPVTTYATILENQAPVTIHSSIIA
jgi:hypothetical protein